MATMHYRASYSADPGSEKLGNYKCIYAQDWLARKYDGQFIELEVSGRRYQFPKELGKEELCTLCKNQLECLAGSETGVFTP